MAMIDEYEPSSAISCVWCDAPVVEWQGKDGPCVLVRWVQGRRDPVEILDAESVEQLRPDDFPACYSLPERFQISGWCTEDHLTVVSCTCDADGIWTTAEVDVNGTGAVVEAVTEPRRRIFRRAG